MTYGINKKDAIFLYKNRSSRSIIYAKTHKIYKFGEIACKEYKKHEIERVILNIEISRLLGDSICNLYLGHFQSNGKYILFYNYLTEYSPHERRQGLYLIKKFHSMSQGISITDLTVKPEKLNILDELKKRCFGRGELDKAKRFPQKYKVNLVNMYHMLFHNIHYNEQIIHGDFKFNNIVDSKIIDLDHVRIGPIEYDIARYFARRNTCSFNLIPNIIKTVYQNYDTTLIMKFYLHHTLTFMAQSLGENNISLQETYYNNTIMALNHLDLSSYIDIFCCTLLHNNDVGKNICE